MWLETKEKLQPALFEEAKRGASAPPRYYMQVAHTLPTKPELHRPVIEKVAKEDLSLTEITTLSQALRRAEDEEEIQSILRQPVSRTEDQMVREAKVEKLLSQPRKQVYVPAPEGKYRTIVIGPPWPIEKILREVRPNQLDLDYPTITL